MALGKYRKWFILYLIIVGLLISMQVIMFFTTSMRRAYKFMPFENFFLNNLIIMIFWFLAPIIGVLVAYLFESLLLGIHKKLIGKRATFGIEEKESHIDFKFKFTQLFFPALMAVNLTMILWDNQFLQDLILITTSLEDPEHALLAQVLMVGPLFVITITISVALFVPAYILVDSGIIYTNKEKAMESRDTAEVRSVGNFYLNFLKGYAGIGVIINFYIFFAEAINEAITSPSFGFGQLMGLILWAILPLVVSFLMLPMVFLIR
ncbi:hypothetical protein ES703_17698 [subsurface metagenome]